MVVTKRVPASYAQRRLWFLDRLEGGNAGYNISQVLKVKGELDSEALAAAFQTIVRRHESLRTHFDDVDGEPVQVIDPDLLVEVPVYDLSSVKRQRLQERVEALITQESKCSFDLSRGPLIRMQILKAAADEHIILRTMHHIVSDAWSEAVFNRELKALYNAYKEGRENPLEPLSTQYSDFSIWQRNQLEQGLLEAGLQYWTRQLAGMPDHLELPTDHSRPPTQTSEAETCEVSLSKEVVAALKSVSRRHKATLYMTLLSGLGALLSRYSGQYDFAIGTPVANRQETRLEDLIGYFVNTLVMRLRLDPAMTFQDLLAQVRSTTLNAYQYEYVPFERLVEEISPRRNLNRAPLFQIIFALQNAPRVALELSDLDVEQLSGGRRRARFELEVYAIEREGAIRIVWVYDCQLFGRARIERMSRHYVRVLEAIAANAAEIVEAIPLLTEEERRTVLWQWNATAVEYQGDKSVHNLFEEQARKTPDVVAVVSENTALSYQELDRRADRLARHLRLLSVSSGARVGICMERGLEMIISLLAVLKAGGAYVPLDPEHPSERLRYILNDSKPVAILTQQHLRSRLPQIANSLTVLEIVAGPAEWGQDTEPHLRRSDVGLTGEDLAYVIYTSGSTGLPKGVMVSHAAIVNFLNSMQRSPGLTAADVLLSVTTFSFDIAALEFYLPLSVGGQLRLASREVIQDGQRLLQELRHGVTVMQATPTTWQMLLEAGWTGNEWFKLLCGGEALNPVLANKLMVRSGSAWNMYGPTETTIWSSTEQLEASRKRVSIGQPIGNTEIYVLDGNGEPVPVGVDGELYIGGAGVARGYWNRAELTAERFVPNPFAGRAGERMYRSGDVGRWLEEGRIEYVGRNDFQVKVRGFRIELGEIEARLAGHPGVREAVVVAREEGAGDKRLVAYYSCVEKAGAEEVGVEELRRGVAAGLPEYMAPAAYVRLEKLPRTANGKLDRRALPEPTGDAYVRRGYEEPEGETERALAEIWAEVLKVERVGRQDNFFEVGGHSLLAVRVISRLHKNLGVEVTIRELFAAPTLAEFAERVGRAGRATQPGIARADREGLLPLSFAQQRLWFLAQMEGVSQAYHIPLGLRLVGRLNRQALGRALERILERHEVLRTVFANVAGEPVQQILAVEESRFRLQEQDLTVWKGEVGAELEEIVRQEAGEAFDLRRGPLIRGRLVKLGEQEHALLLTMHHIVADGWSSGVLMNELSVLYGASERGEADPLPELGVQYADYAVWQREWMEGEVLKRQGEYWERELAGAQGVLELPGDHPRPGQQDYSGDRVEIVVEEELAWGLRELSRRLGTTLYMTLLAGWAGLLGRLSGEEEVVIGTPVANRGRVEIEGLIGLFVNMLALRVKTPGEWTVRELLEHVKQQVVSGQQHQDIPFEQVVEMVHPTRSLSHSPIFQIGFSWQNAAETIKLTLPGLEVGPLDAMPHVGSKLDMTLSLRDLENRIAGHLEYATALFDRSSAEKYLGYLQMLLKGMVQDDTLAVGLIPILSEAERQCVLTEWGRAEVEPVSERCFQELFEEQVQKTPDAAAVIHENSTISYGKLNRRANQLAHYLRKLGIKPDQRVAICADRDIAMIVAILAVMKAGGAYLPLDPAHPVDRLRYMLKDSLPSLILTQEHLKEALVGIEDDLPMIDLNSADAWNAQPESNLYIGNTSAQLAYLIYTSGSTGRPKAVMIEHHGLVSLAPAQLRSFSIPQESRVLQFASFSFDACIFEIAMALLRGACLYLPPRRPALASEGLLQVLMEYGITHATLPPAVLATLPTNSMIESLGVLVVAGEALPESLPQRWAPGRQFINAYGPTETTVWATSYRCSGDESGNPPIGRPITNMRVYVLSDCAEPLPVRVVGELFIGGAGVGRGYWHRPDLTAERFVPDSFSPEQGARMYRSGDLGRWLDKGMIGFAGRNDSQVKVRGFRIELAEIKSCLEEHSGVDQAVVLVQEDSVRGKQLVAYYTCRKTAEGVRNDPGAEELRRHASMTLPVYMVPVTYIQLESFPLTVNGKLNFQALPPWEFKSPVVVRDPSTPQEKLLCSLFAQVLGVECVGVDDDFFEIGGHSLLAMRLVNHIRTAFGADLSIIDFFDAPTVAGIQSRLALAATACISLQATFS